MRLSIYKDDPGYPTDNPALLLEAMVYLDGKPFKPAVTADEEQGLIVAYIPQDDPRYKMAMASGAPVEWPTEELRGKVEIRFPKVKQDGR